jgi:hypothetical protein
MLDKYLAQCLDLFLEGGSGTQCVDLLSGEKLDSVCKACPNRALKT